MNKKVDEDLETFLDNLKESHDKKEVLSSEEVDALLGSSDTEPDIELKFMDNFEAFLKDLLKENYNSLKMKYIRNDILSERVQSNIGKDIINDVKNEIVSIFNKLPEESSKKRKLPNVKSLSTKSSNNKTRSSLNEFEKMLG